eukprot:GHVU01101923.1.p1 GENE.GHVU01101923.1~~GHVU01101923.1.p1  ORF type:complete len:112 (+),score=5.43 GHVU01101923.1:2-337(+)
MPGLFRAAVDAIFAPPGKKMALAGHLAGRGGDALRRVLRRPDLAGRDGWPARRSRRDLLAGQLLLDRHGQIGKEAYFFHKILNFKNSNSPMDISSRLLPARPAKSRQSRLA